MAELSKDLIGSKLSNFQYGVAREKIKEFLLAINETNPVYHDLAEAKKAGFSDIPVPPTYLTSINFWGNPTWLDDMAKLGIDVKRLLHMKEDYTYHKPLYAPATVTYKSEVSDVKIGKMNMITISGDLTNEKGELLIHQETTVIIRPE